MSAAAKGLGVCVRCACMCVYDVADKRMADSWRAVRRLSRDRKHAGLLLLLITTKVLIDSLFPRLTTVSGNTSALLLSNSPPTLDSSS